MPKITIENGLKVHYWQMGKKNKPNVVLLHGLGGNLAVWYAGVIQRLRKDFRQTTLDLFGHGRTDEPPEGHKLRDILDDIMRFWDALGIDRAHIVGHCWGGDLALNIAHLWPDRVERIVLIETVLGDLAEMYAGTDWVGWAYFTTEIEKHTGIPVPDDKYDDLEYLIRRIQETPLMHGIARGRKRKQHAQEQIERMIDGIEMLRRAKNQDEALRDFIGDVVEANMHQIEHETLLLYEADSLFMPSHDVFKREMPNTVSAFVPPAEIKHLSVLDHSKIMAEYIGEFLTTGDIANVILPDELLQVAG